VLPDASIGIFYGANHAADAEAIARYGLIPVLNSMAQIGVWREFAAGQGAEFPAIIHVDTGMTRVGISLAEAETLAKDAALLKGVDVLYFMSHLACAEMAKHPLNAKQVGRFAA